MAVVIVHQAQLSIIVLAAPLDGLVDFVGAFRYFSIGGVAVGGANVAVGAVEFADILGQVPAISVPGGILLNSQRAGGYGLGRIPGDEPQAGVVATGEVAAGKTDDGCKAGWTNTQCLP